MSGKTGKYRTIYLPKKLDEKIELVRKQLGWSRGFIYKYTISRFLEDLGELSSKKREEEGRRRTPATEGSAGVRRNK
ncbi:MAG: hypothetical protein ACTSV7_08860 [Candidatus Baldrarchaeia archaeon]